MRSMRATQKHSRTPRASPTSCCITSKTTLRSSGSPGSKVSGKTWSRRYSLVVFPTRMLLNSPKALFSILLSRVVPVNPTNSCSRPRRTRRHSAGVMLESMTMKSSPWLDALALTTGIWVNGVHVTGGLGVSTSSNTSWADLYPQIKFWRVGESGLWLEESQTLFI